MRRAVVNSLIIVTLGIGSQVAAAPTATPASPAAFATWRNLAESQPTSPAKSVTGDYVERRTMPNGASVVAVVKLPTLTAPVVTVSPPAAGVDATPVLAAAVANATSTGAHKITLQPGVYRFLPRASGDGMLLLRNLNDFTLEGTGATTLLFAGSGSGIVISNVQRLRLTGVTIDYDVPTSGSGVVVAADGHNAIKLDSGPLQATTIHQVTVQSAVDTRLFFGGTGLPVTISNNVMSAGANFDSLALGARVVVKYDYYLGAAIMIKDAANTHTSNDIVIDHVKIRSATGTAIDVERMGRGLALANVTIQARSGGPPLSAEYDGVHLTSFAGDLIMRSNLISDTGDDAINISSVIHKVSGAPAGATSVNLTHGADVLAAGDTLAFFDSSGSYVSSAKALSLSGAGGDSATVQLDKALPQSDIAYARNLSLPGARVVVRNNTIGPCDCHGVLLQTPNAVAEANTFQTLQFSPVRALTSLNPWLEGIGPFNVQVQDNKMNNTGGESSTSVPQAAISVYMQRGSVLTDVIPGADVSILRNVLQGVAQDCIYANGVQNLTVQGNSCQSKTGATIPYPGN
jgi:hypothetical protein